MRWVTIGACAGLAVGCGGLGPAQLTAAPPKGMGGAAVTGSGGSGTGGSLATDGGPPASDAGARAADAGLADAGAAACPPAPPQTDGGAAFVPVRWSPGTAVPFSCDPLPTSFFFPRPEAAVPGAYARCASFGGGRTTALAVNQDGTRVAMIADDGIVRLVDAASHMVVGVLAPPRASIDRVAFSPAGDTIVTLAKGERVVTLWRADTLAPVWSTTLPGHTYFKTYPGGAMFSPDGATVLISPGADVFLLDAATGAIRATRNQGFSDSSVIAAVNGWNGRRIVVQEAPVSGMCVLGTVGGSVTLLDPDTLAPLATPMTWPQLSDEGPPPGQLAVAAGADLMLTTGAYPDYGIKAFRVSDGTPLPAPNLAAFPLLLTPDGTAAVVAASGGLTLQNLADGTVLASAVAQTPTAADISADGSAIALGSYGADLLDLWRPASGSFTPTCSTPPSTPHDTRVDVSLSADGQTIAVAGSTGVRVMRRVDGTTLSILSERDRIVASVSLSPYGHYAVAEFYDIGAP
ncbi:MAG TPA: WD40 repeat domain-containing protein, partial [Polyangia bacterium]|nr:WD40 repeat domain-containing protein [Polyangia bacterium]